MRIRSFGNPYFNVLLAPDDGSGGSGGSGDETFTKQQLEQIVQGRVAKLAQENADLKKSQADQAQKLAELEAKISSPPNPPPHTPPGDDDIKGRMKLIENQHKSELEAIKNKLDAETKKREAAEKRRKEVERDSQVTAALQAAGCRADALSLGASHFTHQVELNEDEDKWFFRLKDGAGTVSIADGIKAELPDFLKEPSITAGGSGSRSGTKNEGKKTQLQAAKDKLNKLKEYAEGSQRESDMQAFLQQKRIVQNLEREVGSS